MLFSCWEILGIWERLTDSHLTFRDLPRKSSWDKNGVLVNPGMGIRLRRSQGSSRGSGSACRGKSFAGSWEWSWNHTLEGWEWAQIPTWNRCRGMKQHHPLGSPSDGIWGIFPTFPRQILDFSHAASGSVLRPHREAKRGKEPPDPEFWEAAPAVRIPGSASPGGRDAADGWGWNCSRSSCSLCPFVCLRPRCRARSELVAGAPIPFSPSRFSPLFFFPKITRQSPALFSARWDPDPPGMPRAGGFQRQR